MVSESTSTGSMSKKQVRDRVRQINLSRGTDAPTTMLLFARKGEKVFSDGNIEARDRYRSYHPQQYMDGVEVLLIPEDASYAEVSFANAPSYVIHVSGSSKVVYSKLRPEQLMKRAAFVKIYFDEE